jgi:hypothetical protein
MPVQRRQGHQCNKGNEAQFSSTWLGLARLGLAQLGLLGSVARMRGHLTDGNEVINNGCNKFR